MKALIERRNNSVVPVFLAKRGGFTTKESLSKKSTMNAAEIKLLKEWARRRKYKVRVFDNEDEYPFLILDSDTKMVNAGLARRLNRIGRKMKRYVWIGEGLRTYARQKELWDQYVARNYAPPLTARPGTSNHETGNAADASLFVYGSDQGYVNLGKIKRVRRLMRRYGLCLPVSGEPWHVEVGSVWRS